MTLRQNLILILCLAALLGANSHADETPRQVDAVVIFSQFADEAATPVPGYAGDLIDSTVPDSFSHFYHTMSSGQFSCPGARRSSALSFRPVRGDLTVVDGEFGDYPTFVREILVQADAISTGPSLTTTVRTAWRFPATMTASSITSLSAPCRRLGGSSSAGPRAGRRSGSSPIS